MCCFCNKSANYSTQYSGCYGGCNTNLGCVKPIQNQCYCDGYLQNGWGKDCGSSSNCFPGSSNKWACGCNCKCNKPKCQQNCNNGMMKIKLEGIIKFC